MYSAELFISGIRFGERDFRTRIGGMWRSFMVQREKWALFLFLAMLAPPAAHGGKTRITVLDSETHSVVLDSIEVPKNCDGISFDAYCFNNKTAAVTNILLVQQDHQPPYQISCSVESKWSRCASLPAGGSFEARKEKRGIVVYFVDDAGKLRKQFYTYVNGEGRHCCNP